MADAGKVLELQTEKFKRTARELGCDDDEAAFDRALKQMKPPPEKAETEKVKDVRKRLAK